MVEVLLATYNGETYIEEQVLSLINQTYQDLKIIIRDDNSSDNTKIVINKLKKKYPEKIVLIEDCDICGSAKANFMKLLKYAKADYVMFCDQDDFWFPEKVEKMLCEMKKHEQEFGGPILIYSDYIATDEKLNPLNENIKNGQVYNPKLDLNHLIVQNYINGCAMMVNRALYKNTLRYRDEMLMHDWWLAIYAATFGQAIHMNVPLMFYRQHSGNVVGAVDIRSFKYIKMKILSKETKKANDEYIKQIAAFLDEFRDCINEKEREIIETFLDIPKHGKIYRVNALIKGKYLKSTLLRKLGQFFYI